ncbi:MAG: cell division protein ZapA [Bacteroidales bacterium]|nr:cell division protein ZapA [Bacteroidales bacterium]
MSENKKLITLYVAQQAFKLTIPESQEVLYREAERNINTYIRSLSEKIHSTDKFTLMGYAVINFAMKNILLNEKQKFVDSDLLEVLKKIQTTVNEVLDE